MPQHRRARAAAQMRARDAATKFNSKLKKALVHYPPPDRIADTLNHISNGFGVVDHLPLSNFHVRIAFADTLIDLLLQHYDRVRNDRKVRHFLFTATFNDGITYENEPKVDFARIKLKVRRLLRELGLDAICVFEVDVLNKPQPGDPARLLLFHVHAVCWTRDRTFAPVKAARELSARAPFANRLGVPGITFVSRAMSAAKHRPSPPRDEQDRGEDLRFRDLDRDQNAWSIAYLARYMSKAPFYAKDRYEAADGRGRVCRDEQAFGLNTALRFAEILSQITPMDAVFGVGTHGGALARQFSGRIRRLHQDLPSRRQQSLTRGEVARAWQQFFAAHPRLGFLPACIKHRAG